MRGKAFPVHPDCVTSFGKSPPFSTAAAHLYISLEAVRLFSMSAVCFSASDKVTPLSKSADNALVKRTRIVFRTKAERKSRASVFSFPFSVRVQRNSPHRKDSMTTNTMIPCFCKNKPAAKAARVTPGRGTARASNKRAKDGKRKASTRTDTKTAKRRTVRGYKRASLRFCISTASFL